MNVSASTNLIPQNQIFQSQSSPSGFAPQGVSLNDNDGDNDSIEKSQSESLKGQLSDVAFKTIFSALNTNGTQGISTNQLLNALNQQSSLLTKPDNNANGNKLQNTLMNKILSSYDNSNPIAQSNKVLSA
jgi:hypothetical protein